MSHRNKLTIIRGLPGSGKSTLGRKLAAESGGIFIEPDMFLIHSGEYGYTPQRYEEAVRQALMLAHKADCDVIYADVLPTRLDVTRVYNSFHFGNYGQGQDKEFRVISLRITVEESLEKNIHHVNEADIRRMAETWETIPVEEEMQVGEFLFYEKN